ncbi:putative dienelactone hydrolase [Phyllobacterium sp. 1468]|nr:putative dienelactone hydrolase [Phyllobacterium sp. 1468]
MVTSRDFSDGNRFCEQIRSAPTPPLAGDARIKAAVLVDPAGDGLFTADGLGKVTVPVQLWASNSGDPELCTDHAGFDRVAFHKQFDADILAFFRKNLIAAEQ